MFNLQFIKSIIDLYSYYKKNNFNETFLNIIDNCFRIKKTNKIGIKNIKKQIKEKFSLTIIINLFFILYLKMISNIKILKLLIYI